MFTDGVMESKPRVTSKFLDLQYEKAQEKIKEAFWGDFLFGGLLVSGIFIVVDNLNLSQEVSLYIGFFNICLALLLMFGRLRLPKINQYRINKINDKVDTLYKTKNYEECIHNLEKIIKIDHEFKSAWYNKGKVLGDLGRLEEAIKSYDNALEIDEKFKAAWFNKGVVLDDLERVKEAIKCYDKVLEIDEKFKRAWNNKGVALDESGRSEEAIKCYNKALEIDPKYPFPIYNKACFESLRNNKQESIKLLKKAIKLDDSIIERAKSDSDFDNIRDSDEFKELIG